MPVYQAPLRDMRYLLHDFLEVTKYGNMPGFADITPDLTDAILEEGAKLTQEVMFPLNQSGDEEGCHFDGGKVKPPKGFKPKFTVQNIVASAALSVELDLYTIASKIEDVEYEPEQFPGAILKFPSPKTSLLLFKNGKIICTGGRSESDVETALNMAAKLLAPYSSPLPQKK